MSTSANFFRGQLPVALGASVPSGVVFAASAQTRTLTGAPPAIANVLGDSDGVPVKGSKGASAKYVPPGIVNPPRSSGAALPQGDRTNRTWLWSTNRVGVEVLTWIFGAANVAGAEFPASSNQTIFGT